MRSLSLRPFLAAVASCLLPLTALHAAWLPEIEGLPYDPILSSGQLDNGMRYLHAQTTDKNNRVSVRLIVNAGSNHEEDDELGYAHFVEHMAFNGTRNFPADTLRATLARAGVRIGPEVNAFTSPSHTVYQLDLPNDDPATFELALQVMRDWCDGLKIEAREVKREAKVILAEINARGLVAGPFAQERMGFVYPDHPLGERNPAGTPHSVDRARADDLRDFYERWYRPDNVVLAIVADKPSAEIDAAVARHFGSFRARGPLAPQPSAPPAVNPSSPRLHWTQIGPIKSFNFEIIHTRPTPATDSVENFRQSLITQLALQVIQSRLNRQVLFAPSEVERLQIYEASPSPDVAELTLSVSGRPEHWKTLLHTLLTEYRGLRKYGFLPEEVADAREVLLNRITYEESHPSHADVPAYASRLTDAVRYQRVLPADATTHALAREILPTLTPETCREALADYLATGQARYFIYGDLGEAGMSKNLVEALQEGTRLELTPPSVNEDLEFPYTSFGEPAAIVSERTDPATDVEQVHYANGVTFNFKPTSFEQDTVEFIVRLKNGGHLRTDPAQPGVPEVAEAALIAGGLGQLDIAGITRALDGHAAEITFAVTEDALLFTGSTEREQLPLLCRIVAAYLTDPALAENAVSHAVAESIAAADRAFNQAEASLAANFHYALAHEDPRLAAPLEDDLKNILPADLRAWLEPQFAALPIEVSIVGDINSDLARDAVAATFGSLPPRQPLPAPPPFNWLREDQTFHASSYSQRAATAVLWPIPVDGSVRQRRELELLSKCVGERVVERLREDTGLTYSPRIETFFPETDDSVGYLRFSLITQLRYVERAAREIRKVGDQLASRGIDDDLLLQALNPALNSLDAQLRSNRYWLHSVLDGLSEHPEQLTYADSRRTDLESISAQRLSELARQYLDKNQAIELYAGTGEKGKSMF
ncbi:M16 family metallopeptidase [Actomonas aquatica]|uniref:Insulinase family protein n=1 Tax=Actomonas aquatica TaxID=2866162 RepID=A0ABZ1C7V3_9BACT|nr:M16 family metallopeptidase [Opitutus sp. WL0086]WRQ87470.1 insulinase family protein [Opitutus sp. WL0086]